jgi:hypothetical protein
VRDVVAAQTVAAAAARSIGRDRPLAPICRAARHGHAKCALREPLIRGEHRRNSAPGHERCQQRIARVDPDRHRPDAERQHDQDQQRRAVQHQLRRDEEAIQLEDAER